MLEDINTLLTLSDTKGEIFQSNQTIRVCDQIANDVAVLFGQKYLGTVPNDASGRPPSGGTSPSSSSSLMTSGPWRTLTRRL